MVYVEVKNQEQFEKYFKIFNSLVKKQGFLRELRERRYFMTKKEKLKLKREKARKFKRSGRR